jgi:hypothetical protein
MKKSVSFIVLLTVIGCMAYPANLGSLDGVLKPVSITVEDGRVYLMEAHTVLIYSLKDLKLLHKFGKKGDGPGELQFAPNYCNKLTVYQDMLQVETFLRLVYFSKEGKFLKEIRKKSPFLAKTLPVGKNYVINKLAANPETNLMDTCISLFDDQMNEIKMLYRQPHLQQGDQTSLKFSMVMDVPHICVADGKIFVDESPDGFIIEVFDSQGKPLYKIQKEYEKVKVTGDYKDKAMEKFKADPFIKGSGGWENLKNIVKPEFPDTLPPIQGIFVSGDKLYVQTYVVTPDNKEEYLVMDLKGNNVKRFYIPHFDNVTILGKLMGSNLHTIADDKLYYLLENEEEEEWELHAEPIKPVK